LPGAGVGAVALPGPVGLNSRETGRTATTKALAMVIYTAGGIAATAAYRAVLNEKDANSVLAEAPV
jgi:hypothetical protein